MAMEKHFLPLKKYIRYTKQIFKILNVFDYNASVEKLTLFIFMNIRPVVFLTQMLTNSHGMAAKETENVKTRLMEFEDGHYSH